MSDFYKMSAMMKDLFPSNPEADKQALKAMAGNPQESVAPTKDYVQESVEVPQGSMPLGIDNVSDFAKLAGVTETQKIGSAGQAKGKDPMPAKTKPTAGPEQKHPLRNKLVGEDDDLRRGVNVLDLGDDPASLVTAGLINAVNGEILPKPQREALSPYVGLFVTFMKNPKLLARLNAMKRIANQKDDSETTERSLTKGEEKEKERIVKGMKKAKGDFKDRYGKDAEAVMYATATKMAKKESIETSLRDRLNKALNSQK